MKEAPCRACSGGYIWLGSLKRMANCPVCRGPEASPGQPPEIAVKIGEHEKRCCGCSEVKPRDQFGFNRRSPDGLCSRCRACRSGEDRQWWDQLRTAIFGHYGWSCACCGSTEDLTIDHVNGDGAAHRAELRGAAIYVWLIKNNFPGDFQTLCRACNISKGGGERCRQWHGESHVTARDIFQDSERSYGK